MPTTTPWGAWKNMVDGNRRFISGTPLHPNQDVERRDSLVGRQAPVAALFGCSDSRLAAEIIFDQGLGDLFVIRNAGQIISDSVVGSLEYAIGVLDVPLIVVLGHDECGAVRAAIDSQEPDARDLPGSIRALIEPIVPAVRSVALDHPGTRPDATEVGRRHLRETVESLVDASPLIGDAVQAGTLAIVGANYRLLEGMAVPDIVIGNVDGPRTANSLT